MSDKQLAVSSVVLTLVVMLLPGVVIEYASALIRPLLFWQADLPTQGAGQIDKLVHGLAFAVCGYSVARAWCAEHSLLMIAAMLTVFAVFTELAQIVIPGRSGDAFDLLADGLGLAVGIGVAICQGRWQKKARL